MGSPEVSGGTAVASGVRGVVDLRCNFVCDRLLAPVAIGLLPPVMAGEQYIAGKLQTYLTPAPKKGATPAATSDRRVPSSVSPARGRLPAELRVGHCGGGWRRG